MARPEAAARPSAAVIVNPVNVNRSVVRATIDAEARRQGWGLTRWFETTIDDPGHDATARALELNPSLLIVQAVVAEAHALAELVVAHLVAHRVVENARALPHPEEPKQRGKLRGEVVRHLQHGCAA